MNTTKCECCNTLGTDDDYGRTCRECGGRGMFVAIHDAWNPPEYIVSELAKRGFARSDYRNDVCASMINFVDDDTPYLQIFIDSEIPEDRECESYPRFGIINENQDDLFDSDSFSDVLEYLDAR